MAKVKKHFFCIQEKKEYPKGSEYTGKREDLKEYLEIESKSKKDK